MNDTQPLDRKEVLERDPLLVEQSGDEVRAWEEIETGRYMPRRIRGSCRGRTLG